MESRVQEQLAQRECDIADKEELIQLAIQLKQQNRLQEQLKLQLEQQAAEKARRQQQMQAHFHTCKTSDNNNCYIRFEMVPLNKCFIWN